MKSYVGELMAAEGKLTSATAKADLASFVTALEKSATESQSQATTQILAALGKLGKACP
jgi:hypothetical protein